MDVTSNARKHGITVRQIRDVVDAPLCSVPQGDTVLHIGLDANRDLLEVVVSAGPPVTVLHAMRLRPFNYRYLRSMAARRNESGHNAVYGLNRALWPLPLEVSDR